LKLILNATGLSGNTIQLVLEGDDSHKLNKAILVALYRTKGLASIIDVESNVQVRGPVGQIAEKARIGAFLNELERR